MKLDHHYTLTITCDPPPRSVMLLPTQPMAVMTVSGDYETVRNALVTSRIIGQLERFEATLNDAEPEVTG